MSVRSFSVFQDSPEEDTTATISTKTGSTMTSTSSSTTCSAVVDSILSPTCEKENIHPITGITPSTQQANKKRKVAGSNVLATKSVAPPSSVSSLGKGKRPDLKRRSSSMSSVSSSKSKGKEARSKGDKARRVLGSSENNHSRSSPSPQTPSRSFSGGLARAPTLDAIPEHLDAATVEQALIDSRCYELTVLPLADVSTAYLQTDEGKETSRSPTPEREISVVKEQGSFEHQMRDYFASSHSLSTASSSSSMSRLTPPSDIQEQRFRVFQASDDVANPAPSDDALNAKTDDEASSKPLLPSTPQRKQLYAAFTFTSPLSSPTKSK